MPFSIVPNGNGLTPAGSPAGNNPSGSPLGPVGDRNQVVPGSPVVVGDLSTYLSQAYGAGVDPSKPSSVSTLYPLSSLTLQALTGQSTSGVFNPDGTFVTGVPTGLGGNSAPAGAPQFNGPNASPLGIGNGPYGGGKILGTFSCSGGSGLTQGQGKVVSVQPGRLVVAGNNGQVVLRVAPCSNLNSVQKNMVIVPQTPVYFKGVQTAYG